VAILNHEAESRQLITLPPTTSNDGNTMATDYPFVDRESELAELRATFTEKVLRAHGCLAYLMQGRNGVGKTRLMKEFLRTVQDDVLLHADIPAFRVDEHVMYFDCADAKGKPYEPFKAITDKIHSQQRLLHLIQEAFFLVLSFFNVDTILGRLKSIGTILSDKKKDEEKAERDTALFNRYRRTLTGFHRKTPLVIFIENAQRIDVHSLKLLKKVIRDQRPLWGMIILEDEQGQVPGGEIQGLYNRMIGDGDLSRIVVRSLGTGFPAELLESVFPGNLFESSEYDVMYALSEGCPGILIEEIEKWKKYGWLEFRGDRWQKCPDFKDRIKPKPKRLLERVINYFDDGVLSEGEKRHIYEMAAEWGISEAVVSRTIAMVRDITSCRYRLQRRIGPGIVSVDSFEALDDGGTHVIIEYLQNDNHVPVSSERIGIKHANLLEARDVRVCGTGVLVCWDYREGRRIREMMREAHENQIKKSVAMLKQIAPAMAELHRAGGAHGYIQPESIIESLEGRFYLASFNPSLLNILIPSLRQDRETLSYLAPEVLNGAPADARSDVYSLGVLFYNLLTNRFPFEGGSREELLNSIRLGKVLADDMPLPIPLDIQNLIRKCLSYYQDFRYQNAGDFLADLNKVDPEWHPETKPAAPPAPKPKPSLLKRMLPAAAVLLICLIVLGAGWYFLTRVLPPPSVVDVITVEIKQGESTSSLRRPLSARATQFLILDDISQSSKQLAISRTMFERLYGGRGRRVPRLVLAGEILASDLEYELQLKFSGPQGIQEDTVYRFSDPSALLQNISQITRAILSRVGVTALKPSTFTSSWDAFEYFFKGDSAWRRLNVTVSEQSFNNALSIDTGFVLAKVRLADVYRFNGQRLEALALLASARPHLSKLSASDSLRAEGLQCRLAGDPWEAVKIYKQVKNLLPGRRTAEYDVAECYYQLRETRQAEEHYREAIRLDSTFAPAYNHLGYCYSHRGDHKSALICFTKYLALDSSANAYDSMGDGLFAAGSLDEAMAAKSAGITIDPQLGYLYTSRAYICIRAGRFKQAREDIDRYMNYAGTDRELRAAGYAALAHLCLVQDDLSGASKACADGLESFDSMDITSRNHQLHWLAGLIALRTGNLASARHELSLMESMIRKERVGPMRYNEIYKYYLHLRAAVDLRQGARRGFDQAVMEFDGDDVGTKVKDGGSPFDRAYFNTSLGVLIIESVGDARENAEQRYKKALEYNPGFPGALFHLGRLYAAWGGHVNEAAACQDRFSRVWHGADPGAAPER
jgi:serine/threonine protein kinase/Flp pilus assembly protein TadD